MKRKNVTSSPFLAAISSTQATPSLTLNEKGALSLTTTGSKCLDWFSSGGAMRNEDDAKIQAVFAEAFKEDKLLATKIAFYIRDVRGGQGQRKSFRSVLKWMTLNSPNILKKNIHLIPFFGRWDDTFVLFGTPLENDVMELIAGQLHDDLVKLGKSENVSLLAKWLPSNNTSSKSSRLLASRISNMIGVTPRVYRKTLVKLRAKINVVEPLMCSKQWSNINYENVPSRAAMIYRKAFPKHDPAGYSEWKAKAFKGEAKVHSATLYPYDIVSKVLKGQWDETLELQWRNLPNYFAGTVHNGIVVCDTSGSMTSWTNGNYKGSVTPMDIAISISMYMAERSNGIFKDHFITFSHKPELQKIVGATLCEKAQNLKRAHWEMNTDVQAVFDMILNKAKAAKLKQSDMPDSIWIVSDLQFDYCGFNETNFELIKAKYKQAGYNMPVLIFWQVRYNSDKVSLENEKGVIMISGFSPSIIAHILKLEKPKEVTPYEMMMKVINSPRYSEIKA